MGKQYDGIGHPPGLTPPWCTLNVRRTLDRVGNPAGPLTNGNRNYAGTLEKYRAGECITCAYRAPTPAGNDGAVAIGFQTGTTATMTLPGGRRTNIELFAF